MFVQKTIDQTLNSNDKVVNYFECYSLHNVDSYIVQLQFLYVLQHVYYAHHEFHINNILSQTF